MSISGHYPYSGTETDSPSSVMLLGAMQEEERWKIIYLLHKSLCLHVTHTAFTHFSLAKASHMIIANFSKIGSNIQSCTQRRISGNSGE